MAAQHWVLRQGARQDKPRANSSTARPPRITDWASRACRYGKAGAKALLPLIFLASPVAASDAHWIIAGQGADMASTVWARSRGAGETNPLLQSQAAAVALKTAYSAGAVLVCKELRRRGHPGKARFLARAVFVVGITVAVWNVRAGLQSAPGGNR